MDDELNGGGGKPLQRRPDSTLAAPDPKNPRGRQDGADLRDAVAEQRDDDAEQRDDDALQRDDDADERDMDAGRRDAESAHRDGEGDLRDSAAEERDESAARRDRAADHRDRLADRHDRDRGTTDTGAPAPPNDDQIRAADNRRLAREDRQAAATERFRAAADRATSLADRQASAEGRDLSGQERGTALADRGTAHADRVAGASGRDSSGFDRDAALAEVTELQVRMAESEARAWRVLKAVPDPIIVAGADGVIELVNVQAVQLFGYPSDELVGQPVERLIPARLHEAHRRHRRGFVAALEPTAMTMIPDIVAVRKDGSTFPVEVKLSAISLGAEPAVLTTIRDISEHKLAEAELRISDDRFRVSFDRAPIGMALIDLRSGSVGRFLRVNRSMCELLARSEGDLLASTTAAVTHPDDRDDTAVKLDLLANTGAARWDTDKRLLDGTGHHVWVHLSVSVVHDPSGQPAYGVSQVEDISDRKSTEAQLQERFHELSTNVDVGFLVRQLDPPKSLYFNPAYLTIFGLDPKGPAPMPGNTIALLDPPDSHRVRSLFDRAAAAAERLEQVWQFTRPDGESRWVSCRVSPITDEDGQIRRVTGLFEDITERRNAEAALAESLEQFRELANNVDVGFSIREPDESGYLFLNDEFLSILGFDTADGWPSVDQVLACHRPIDIGPAMTVEPVPESAGRNSQDWRLLRPDGAVRWVRNNIFPVLDPDGRTRRVVGIVEDITERKAAEQAVISARAEAERANAAKTEFLSRMSHELRTPLNAILGFGQLMEMDNLTGEHRDGVRHIQRAGEHLLELIDEVLDIARMEAGAIRLSVEPVRVGDVVDQTVGMLAPLAARRRIQIAVDSSGLDIHALADHQRLKQVVINLLANAVKYNNIGGEVRIECSLTNRDRVRLTVSDTGIGIAEHDLGRLFQPFERLSAEQSGVEGTGLGLALVKRMIAEMGGEIGVRSQLGKGSSFWVELPATVPPAPAGSTSGAQQVVDQQPMATGPMTALYFEDNLSNVRLLEQIFARRPGVELLVAMQGRIGLDMAHTHRPDLILLDLHLPDMSGEEILHRLRASPPTFTTPIAILSADATPDKSKRLLAAGATWYVTKPINLPRILEIIDSAGASVTTRSAPAGRVEPGAGRADTATARVGVDLVASDDGIARADEATDYTHEMINLLGVIMTYCDLLESDGAAMSKFPWLEQQRLAAERAIEMTRELYPV